MARLRTESKDLIERIKKHELLRFGENFKSIYNDLLAYSYDAKDSMFYTGDNMAKGLLCNLYGGISLIEILLFSEVDFKPEDENIIISTAEKILDYVSKESYDLTPYVSSDKYKEIFGEKVNQMDTMASAVVFFSLIRRAGAYDKSLKVSDSLTRRMAAEITKIFTIFEKYAGRTVENCGWGPLPDSKQRPTLANTYKVVEAFSRFEDSVLKKRLYDMDSDEESEDTEFITLVGKELVYKLFETVKSVGFNVYQSYKSAYGERLFNTDANRTGSSLSQITSSSRSTILFYPLYIALITMMAYVDTTLGKDQRDEYQLYYSKTREAIEIVLSNYRKLEAQNQTDIVDIDYYYFNSENLTPKNIVKLRKLDLVCSYLKPLLINAKSMIIRSLTKYPQPEMSGFYDEMIRTIYTDGDTTIWLWNENEIDLFATERNLSSILYEYMSYYERYEMYFKAGTAIEDNQFEAFIEQRAAKRSLDKISSYQRKIKALEEEKERRVRETELQLKNYKAEVEEKTKIVAEFESLIIKTVKEYLSNSFENLILSNVLNEINPDELNSLERLGNKYSNEKKYRNLVSGASKAAQRINIQTENMDNESKEKFMSAVNAETLAFRNLLTTSIASMLLQPAKDVDIENAPRIFESLFEDGDKFFFEWAVYMQNAQKRKDHYGMKKLFVSEKKRQEPLFEEIKET